MSAVTRALISVSDKTGLVDFARHLSNRGIEILSTGGDHQEHRRGFRHKEVGVLNGPQECGPDQQGKKRQHLHANQSPAREEKHWSHQGLKKHEANFRAQRVEATPLE